MTPGRNPPLSAGALSVTTAQTRDALREALAETIWLQTYPHLSALKARVEAATGPDRDLDREIHAGLGLPGHVVVHRDPLWNLYTSSVDAALSLVKRTLPGWRWVAHSPRSGLAYGASLSDPKCGGWIVPAEHQASAPLAILLALIKALERLAENPGATSQAETSHAR